MNTSRKKNWRFSQTGNSLSFVMLKCGWIYYSSDTKHQPFPFSFPCMQLSGRSANRPCLVQCPEGRKILKINFKILRRREQTLG
ncbi:uncharacterized protein LOC144287835 isoform X4 [Canis aureus]